MSSMGVKACLGPYALKNVDISLGYAPSYKQADISWWASNKKKGYYLNLINDCHAPS